MAEGAPRAGLRRRLGRFGGQAGRAPSLNRLIPNILTMMGLCAGLVAIRFAFDGRFAQAAAFIVAAGVIDGLDGRIARLLKGTSRFGAEFDSLADFLSFGVAPALIMYLWTMNQVGPMGFVPCVMFAVCSSLRLARFNAASIVEPGSVPAPRPAFASNFFTGVPAPAGAGLALFPLFASLAFGEWGWTATADAFRRPLLSAVVLLVVGALMVSTLPSWSFKKVKIPPRLVLPLLLGVGGFVAVLVTEPWAALAAAALIYAGMLIFSARAYGRLAREHEATHPPG
ncbi:CDP-alcohol phosphatidyltransferase family protein [Sabulicella glaciei]|uniref:Phosphatidylcholine/phosphatidylserine synthase n=1 Tax=Sabulicella glaciei TaxID=2984948 RepID=A0ABT3NWL1_9PROT|nr:phosphatidylcholine/phosphatidylserine synthase [Roseococcus sp. MDT2-1-1]MCW8086547.1 phosphatidylcholine/phosphatidylserine synthase [Roseococcus sp. MDT2-1-1]